MAPHPNTRYNGRRMTEEDRKSQSFSRDETKLIRDMLGPDDVPQLCPRCDNKLQLQGPVAGGGSIGFVWRAECPTCDLTTFVAESMARPPEEPDT